MMQVFDIEQNSDAWMAARAGLPTASQFGTILAKGEGKIRRTYLLKLAGEIITGQPSESYSNANMERGHEMEGEAREVYSFLTGADIKLVGFIRNGNKGASPDFLIGNDGLGEIKTKAPHILIDLLLKDQFPAEHKAQCQGALWVAEREWIDITCYWPKIPTFIKRAYRDEAYIANLSAEVDRFNEELQQVVETVRAYGLLEAV